MLVVDTNVLIYAADANSQFHDRCRDWLERQRSRPHAWYTTWSILYEFLRVSTHPRVMRRPWNASAAWGFVAALLASPGLADHGILPALRGNEALERAATSRAADLAPTLKELLASGQATL